MQTTNIFDCHQKDLILMEYRYTAQIAFERSQWEKSPVLILSENFSVNSNQACTLSLNVKAKTNDDMYCISVNRK